MSVVKNRLALFLKWWQGLSDRPKKLKLNILIYESRKEIMFFCRYGYLKTILNNYQDFMKIIWNVHTDYGKTNEIFKQG